MTMDARSRYASELTSQRVESLASRLQSPLGVVCIGGLGGPGLCELQMELKARCHVGSRGRLGGEY